MKQQTVFMVLITTVLLAITACRGDGASSGAAKATVNGLAVKGILKNVDIALYAIENNIPAAEPLAQTVTDAEGKYRFAGLAYSGAALIKATGNDSAAMVCDVPDGCDDGNGGTAAFGEDVPFGTGQVLEAVTVVSGGSVSVNVSPLTHLAAAKAKAAGLNEAGIALANSHVANLFGLTGNLTEMPVLDITNAETLAGADSNVQKGALLAAALYSASLQENKTLDELATMFVDADGQFINSLDVDTPDGIVDLAEILAKAQSILSLPAYNGVSVQAATSLATQLAAAENAGDTYTDAAPSDTAVLANLNKAKAFVEQLRTLGTSFITENSADAFADELEAANLLLSGEAENLLRAVDYAVEAIIETESLRREGDDELISPHMVHFEGVDVEVSFTGDHYSITSMTSAYIEGMLSIDISAVYIMDVSCEGNACANPDEESGTVYTEKNTLKASMDISGEVSLPLLKLEIVDGSKASVEQAFFNSESLQEADQLENDIESVQSEYTMSAGFTGDLDLNVKLTQRVAADGVANLILVGNLAASLKNFSLDAITLTDSEDSSESSFHVLDVTSSSTSQIELATLHFDGYLELEDNRVDVLFDFEAAFNGVVIEDEWSEGYHRDESGDEAWSETEETTVVESDSQFIRGHFSLVVAAALAGIDENSTIELTGFRSALNLANVAAKISYKPGKQFAISAPIRRAAVDAEVTTPVVTVANQDGVIAELTENTKGEMTGIIKVGGVQYASISEPNLIVVRYADGSIESVQ